MAIVSSDVVRTICERALARVGVPKNGAEKQVDLLIEAELRGRSSHGLLRLPRVIERIENGVASATATGLHTPGEGRPFWRSMDRTD